MITYNSKYSPRVFVRSFVMSQDHTSSGRRAQSSGFFVAGWVRWRRRSPTSFTAGKMRCIVAIEHRYTPRSKSRAQTCAGADSQNSADRNTTNTSAVCSGDNALTGLRRRAVARTAAAAACDSAPSVTHPTWSQSDVHRPRQQARRTRPSGSLVLGLGRRALREHLQERVCFSRDFQRQFRAR